MFEQLVCIVSGLLEVLLFLSVFRYCDALKDGIGAGSGPTDEDAVRRRTAEDEELVDEAEDEERVGEAEDEELVGEAQDEELLV